MGVRWGFFFVLTAIQANGGDGNDMEEIKQKTHWHIEDRTFFSGTERIRATFSGM